MRTFLIDDTGARETDRLPTAPLAAGCFCWVAVTREELAGELATVQSMLQATSGTQLVDLHVADLLNPQLPSHYDYISQYDVLVFRRLASQPRHAREQPGAAAPGAAPTATPTAAGPGAARPAAMPAVPAPAPTSVAAHPATAAVLRRIDTRPVGFAVFPQVLLSVHPQDCVARDAFAARLVPGADHAEAGAPDGAASSAAAATSATRLPSGPADLMLRMVAFLVDGYLDLRRDLSRQLDHWQTELLRPKGGFMDWSALLAARLALHQLDEICEDQRAAIQDWLDALETAPLPDDPRARREQDLLQVRSRDVLEHIERVVHHVRRLEQSAETTVQMHFSLQSNRTNDIMRVLTTLTAIFLPLNLIAGVFGMNFEFIPLTHKQDGFWLAMGAMALITLVLVLWFWRQRYLARPR